MQILRKRSGIELRAEDHNSALQGRSLRYGWTPCVWSKPARCSKCSESADRLRVDRLQLRTADVLHLSIKTIEFHRSRLMDKLGVHTVAELTKVALQQGLIPE